MTIPVNQCRDCGTDTCPIDAERNAEWYMVHDDVWARSGLAEYDGCLCIGCLEARIGRQLTPDDFIDAPVNDLAVNPETSDKAYAYRTQRFNSRLTGQMELTT